MDRRKGKTLLQILPLTNMKFAKCALLSVVASAVAGTVGAFAPASPSFMTKTTIATTTPLFMSTETNVEEEMVKKETKKEERLRMINSDQFFRKGFKEVRKQVKEDMKSFESPLVDELKTSNYVVKKEGVTVHLAKDFGFCWGVERSIALAYEAVRHYPDKKVHITNELIHNPEVNDNLHKMNVQFIEKTEDNKKRFDTVQEGDVVILPAFGASLEEMDYFDKQNVDVVDTTCPWVSKVWNTVDMHQKKGLTSIIHGKYAHEETVATVSFCEDYICVKDMKEAEMVADYILNGGDRVAFMEHFKNAMSEGFDPDTMLNSVGLANQTTMYKKETRAIGQLFQKTMMSKFGPIEPKKHYIEFDTICDATQERQDAVDELVDNASELGLDFILVVGGWDSSNTAHLLEIPVKAGVRSFHINRAECIGADNTITHRTMAGEIVTEPLLMDLGKDVVMGVTSGASTPDAAVQDSLSSIFMLKKLNA
uniref:4-hydroxy-3-methylbut-2-enyl diphosphate reductase n=1 Tax=Attheya septentrionalis TaxID=420275 RepID=A0A7S2U590_9STRA|mmetsp:Transcript_10989/g.20081  ORF Transcript_10989/g.20081 Transcript_10989/m.20081 type:complete len:481 (+) Transcript_10989:1-1443(+)